VTDTKTRLEEVQSKIEDLSKIETEFTVTEQKKIEIEDSINRILVQLESKNDEINKLEGFSIGGAIKSIFVDKAKSLEQKRNEYYSLSKAYDKLKIDKAGVYFEYKILNDKVKTLTKFKKEFEYLIELRAKELLTENSSQGHALKNILKDFDNEKELLGNLNITKAILDKVLNRLTLLGAAFSEVESYTSWKRHRGRNFRFSKRQAINRAKELNLECKLLLNELEKSFSKIGYTYRTIDLQLVNFENILGMFFDNIFSDLILQQNLSKAIAEVDSVYNKSKKIKIDILNRINKCEKALKRLKEIRESIILNK